MGALRRLFIDFWWMYYGQTEDQAMKFWQSQVAVEIESLRSNCGDDLVGTNAIMQSMLLEEKRRVANLHQLTDRIVQQLSPIVQSVQPKASGAALPVDYPLPKSAAVAAQLRSGGGLDLAALIDNMLEDDRMSYR